MLENPGGKAPPKYAEVLNAGTYEDACAAVKRVDPRAWVNNGDRIRDNLRFDYVERFPEYLCNDCWPCIIKECTVHGFHA